MENFKNALQIYSPKIYLIVIVIGVTIGTSLFVNLFVGTKTETDIWKQMSIEAIYSVGKLEEKDKIKTDGIYKMADELKALGIDDVDAILNRYLSTNGN